MKGFFFSYVIFLDSVCVFEICFRVEGNFDEGGVFCFVISILVFCGSEGFRFFFLDYFWNFRTVFWDLRFSKGVYKGK